MASPTDFTPLKIHTQEHLEQVFDVPDLFGPDRPLVLEAENPEALRPTKFTIHKSVPNPIRVGKGSLVNAAVGDLAVEVVGGEFSTTQIQKPIEVKSGRAYVPRGSHVTADGGAVYVRGGNAHASGKLSLHKNAYGEADSGDIDAFDDARALAGGRATVNAYGKSAVDAFASAKVRADDHSTVRGHESSSVDLHGRAFAHGNDKCTVTMVSPMSTANISPTSKLRVAEGVPTDRYVATNVDHISDFDAGLNDLIRDIESQGKSGFDDGALRAPALNALVRKSLEGIPVGDPRAIQIMEAYTRGWEAAAGEAAQEAIDALTATPRDGREYAKEDAAKLRAGDVVELGFGQRLTVTDVLHGGIIVKGTTPDGRPMSVRHDAIESCVEFHREAEFTPSTNASPDSFDTCGTCGDLFTVDDGVSYHVTSDGKFEYDKDADHTPRRPYDEGFLPAPITEKVAVIPNLDDDYAQPFIPLPPVEGIRGEGTVIGKPAETLVKFGFKDGQPNTVQAFDWDRRRWGRTMTVSAGIGKSLLTDVQRTHPSERKVPEHVAAAFGHCTGKCLMCSRGLTDEASMSRGYGPSCRSKLV